LEARARDETAAAGQPVDEAKPPDTAQYNFTDPESRIMHHKPEGFVQAYNVQIAVEGTLQLIVGEAVTQDTNDKQQLKPMIRTIKEQSRQRPDELLADTGYCSDESLRYLARTKIDGYIATRKMKHGARPGPAPRGPIPREATRMQRMARKLQTQVGAAVYATRKASWNRCWARSSRGAGFGSFCCAVLRRSALSGRSPARRITC
jgi:Transposase DDE domain